MKYSHHQTKYIRKWVRLRTYQHPGRYNLYSILACIYSVTTAVKAISMNEGE